MSDMKDLKIDLRLTPEQYNWVSEMADKATIGRSTFLRLKIEEMRTAYLEKQKEQSPNEPNSNNPGNPNGRTTPFPRPDKNKA